MFVLGELWKAESAGGVIPAGQPVRVTGIDGLRLNVRAGDVPAKEGTV